MHLYVKIWEDDSVLWSSSFSKGVFFLLFLYILYAAASWTQKVQRWIDRSFKNKLKHQDRTLFKKKTVLIRIRKNVMPFWKLNLKLVCSASYRWMSCQHNRKWKKNKFRQGDEKHFSQLPNNKCEESPQGKVVNVENPRVIQVMAIYILKINVQGKDEPQWAEWTFSFSIFMHHSCHAARYVKKKRLRANGCNISSPETQLHMYRVEELLFFDTHWAQLELSLSKSFITKLITYFY